jgi:mannose-6-phosphate isomerase-like protein (cupin superfamily)
MTAKVGWVLTAGSAALFVLIASAQTGGSSKRKAVMITHLYTGPDGQTHAEEIEAKFTTGINYEIFKMKTLTGGELHSAQPGSVIDWHTAPRPEYIITLSGQGEMEVAGGKKIHMAPGRIFLVEDTTGKGHITRVIGSQERITLQLPISDPSTHSTSSH